MIRQFRIIIQKTLHTKSTHCCEAPKSTLSNYLCTKQVPRGTFWKIQSIQMQIYFQNLIKPKYDAYYLTNKVRVHGLVLLFQLSLRVAFSFGYTFWTSLLGVTFERNTLTSLLDITFEHHFWISL